MIISQTILDQIEITRNGVIQVRLALVISNDGVELSSQWHRTSILPGESVSDQINAVNKNLIAMGYTALDDASANRIEAYRDIAQPPEVVQAFKEARAAEAAKLKQATSSVVVQDKK